MRISQKALLLSKAVYSMSSWHKKSIIFRNSPIQILSLLSWSASFTIRLINSSSSASNPSWKNERSSFFSMYLKINYGFGIWKIEYDIGCIVVIIKGFQQVEFGEGYSAILIYTRLLIFSKKLSEICCYNRFALKSERNI